MRVGLTGGIGSGKSEVAKRFAALGAVVIDSDQLAREVVEPGTPGYDQVVAEFGAQVVRPDGSLDREAIGAIVFADPAARERLNAIVHPLVGEATVARLAQVSDDAIVVHDIPLLVEAGMAKAFDAVVVVAADPEVQLDRLVRLRGMTPEAARARMAAQASLDERVAVADYVIHNDGSLAHLDDQVAAVWANLQETAERMTPP